MGHDIFTKKKSKKLRSPKKKRLHKSTINQNGSKSGRISSKNQVTSLQSYLKTQKIFHAIGKS